MKKYVKAEREYSERARNFQRRESSKSQVTKMIKNYVNELNAQYIDAIKADIQSQIFDPILDSLSNLYDYDADIANGLYGARVFLEYDYRRHCIDLEVDPWAAYTDKGFSRCGLVWLIDLVNGQPNTRPLTKDSRGYLSDLSKPDKQFRMDNYLETIADIAESYGFEILGPARSGVDNNYHIPVTTPEFDEMIKEIS